MTLNSALQLLYLAMPLAATITVACWFARRRGRTEGFRQGWLCGHREGLRAATEALIASAEKQGFDTTPMRDLQEQADNIHRRLSEELP
jgi:hypothetical protein